MSTSEKEELVTPRKKVGLNALIVVDFQYDFLTGGALACPRWTEPLSNVFRPAELRIAAINRHILSGFHDVIVFTQDWHPGSHCSFKEQGGTWDRHCVMGTPGAEIHRRLLTCFADIIIRKGFDPLCECYSAFQDADGKPTGLQGYLQGRGVSEVTICGVATEYCVKATALDAVKCFKTTVSVECCVPYDPLEAVVAYEEMHKAGIISPQY